MDSEILAFYITALFIAAMLGAFLGQWCRLRKQIKEETTEMPSRYMVGIPGKTLRYKGDSKLKAWIFWLTVSFRGGEAYDRWAVMTTPKGWLIPRNVTRQHFDSQ